MSQTKRRRPSPALVVAIVALVSALAGTAAGGVAITALNGKEKRQVKKIAKKEARKLDRRIELIPGPPGQNAAEEIVVRESALSSGPRTVSCIEGERVVGGGAETTPPAALSVNGPIVTGGAATGWKAQANDGAPTNALVLCASP